MSLLRRPITKISKPIQKAINASMDKNIGMAKDPKSLLGPLGYDSGFGKYEAGGMGKANYPLGGSSYNQYANDLSDSARIAGQGISDAYGNVRDYVSGLRNPSGPERYRLSQDAAVARQGISDAYGNVSQGVSDAYGNVRDYVSGLRNPSGPERYRLSQDANSVRQGISDAYGDVSQGVSDAYGNVRDYLSGLRF